MWRYRHSDTPRQQTLTTDHLRILNCQHCGPVPRPSKVGESDLADVLDITYGTDITVDEASYIRRHQSSSVTDAKLTLPSAPLRLSGNHIVIDTTEPTVTGVYGVNGNGERGGTLSKRLVTDIMQRRLTLCKGARLRDNDT